MSYVEPKQVEGVKLVTIKQAVKRFTDMVNSHNRNTDITLVEPLNGLAIEGNRPLFREAFFIKGTDEIDMDQLNFLETHLGYEVTITGKTIHLVKTSTGVTVRYTWH